MTFSREELDAKLAANEARLETIETRVDAKLDAVSNRLEAMGNRLESSQREFAAYVKTQFAHTATKREVFASSVSVVITIIGALVAILSFSESRFSEGMGFMSANVHEIELLKQKQAETDHRIDRLQTEVSGHYASLSDKLDLLIKSSPKP